MAVARQADPEFEYPITEEWVNDVRAALAERGAQARLCREIDCSPGTLTELLQAGKKSVLVPAISKSLGITPTLLIVSKDTHEMVKMIEKMNDKSKRALRKLRSLNQSQLDVMMSVIDEMTKGTDSD